MSGSLGLDRDTRKTAPTRKKSISIIANAMKKNAEKKKKATIEIKRKNSASKIANFVKAHSESGKKEAREALKTRQTANKKRRDSAVVIASFVRENSDRKKMAMMVKEGTARRGSAVLIQKAVRARSSSKKSAKGGKVFPGGSVSTVDSSGTFVPGSDGGKAPSPKNKAGGKPFSPKYAISAKAMPARGGSGGCMAGGGGDGPSEVVKGLWLGNREDAMDLRGMRQKGIKYVLNATAQLDNFHEKGNGITYLKINVKDKEGVDLSKFFAQCIGFIEEGVREGGILVHCIAGASRSVTFVLCYLMSSCGERLVLKDAYNWTKARRSVAHPNNSFLVQLAKYEMALHDGKSSIARGKEKIWNCYELNTLKKEAKGHLDSKLVVGGGCSVM